MRPFAILRPFLFLTIMLIAAFLTVACIMRHPTEDRVPPAAMKEALALKAPFGDARTASPAVVATGKAIYEGKGRCFFCHGLSGKGDGPAANLHSIHPPSNFTDCDFQRAREDGELYWIIKNGSPGTGMQALIPAMLTEEEGWDVVAYVRTFCTSHS